MPQVQAATGKPRSPGPNVSRRTVRVPVSHRSQAPAMAVNPVPDGYHTVTAYLVVEDAARALAFYTEAFGAQELT